MIGPWSVDVHITSTGHTVRKNLLALTAVCEASLWPEIIQARNATSAHVARLFDAHWLRSDSSTYNGTQPSGERSNRKNAPDNG